MIYDRDILIDRVIELKNEYNEGKTQRSEGYLSYKILADKCGVEERTIKKWLSKIPDRNGKFQNFTFPAIISLCNFFGCEVEYLLDKEMTCKTKEVTDIHNATGLSEEAIKVLEKANRGSAVLKDCYISSEIIEELKKRKTDNIFLELINHIIEHYLDMGSRIFDGIPDLSLILNVNRSITDKSFPINEIVSYISDIRLRNDMFNERVFKIARENNIKGNRVTREQFLYLRDILLSEGYDEENILNQVMHLNIYLERGKESSDIRYERIDIQDMFSEFLKSIYIEGESNGK